MERVKAPIGPAPEVNQDDVQTLTVCPLCRQQGMVLPEVAATYEALVEKARGQT